MKASSCGPHTTQLTRFGLSNCYLVSEADGLTLIDTSLRGSAGEILAAAARLGRPIRRIAITHAHHDHAGALESLMERLPEAELAVQQAHIDGAVERLFGGASGETVDVVEEAQVERLSASSSDLDHVVATAAEAHPTPGGTPLGDEVRRTLDSRVLGAPHVGRYASPRLRPGGSLTFLSGLFGRATPPRVSAALPRRGLEALLRALARDLAPLRVNAVRPGLIDTERNAPRLHGALRTAHSDMLPAGRVGQPEDVALAIVSLIANPHITGAILPVDGGQSLV